MKLKVSLARLDGPNTSNDIICLSCGATVDKLCCAKCGEYYCSRNCQITDWPKHKNNCAYTQMIQKLITKIAGNLLIIAAHKNTNSFDINVLANYASIKNSTEKYINIQIDILESNINQIADYFSANIIFPDKKLAKYYFKFPQATQKKEYIKQNYENPDLPLCVLTKLF